MLPRASIFAGTSLDGFIARRNHAIDFLPETPEDHGFAEFFASVDGLIMGRHTYDVVLGFGQWPYEAKPVVVLSHCEIERPAAAGALVERMSGEPAAILAALGARGWRHAYVDGGITATSFLAAGLVQRIIVTRVPVLIGEGIPLFAALPRDIMLQHTVTRSFPSGLVQSEYTVLERSSPCATSC